jgi:hypothetical protein
MVKAAPKPKKAREQPTTTKDYNGFRSVVLAELAAFEPGTSFQWRQKEATFSPFCPQFHFTVTE